MVRSVLIDNVRCSAELIGNVAEFKLNLETGQLLDVHLLERNLRFKCKRCATYCCKLGGPCLTKEDIEQIESVGHRASEFVENSRRRYGNHSLMTSAMKNRKDGLCIFLRKDEERIGYQCSIYDTRPTLCRLFPFEVKRIDVGSFVLEVLPCNGLNDADGELVNNEFVVKHLLENNEHLLKFMELF
jgi:Fe-S-cluster containining protein